MAAMQRRLVHKQFNSPINLYSQKNIQETLDRELKLLSNGAVGIDFDDPSTTKPPSLAKSAVLAALEEEEREKARGTGRQSRPRQPAGRGQTTHSVPCIDRETVLKINRRPLQRRHRSCENVWPPPKLGPAEEGQQQQLGWQELSLRELEPLEFAIGGGRRYGSHDSVYFDERIRRQHKIEPLRSLFDRENVVLTDWGHRPPPSSWSAPEGVARVDKNDNHVYGNSRSEDLPAPAPDGYRRDDGNTALQVVHHGAEHDERFGELVSCSSPLGEGECNQHHNQQLLHPPEPPPRRYYLPMDRIVRGELDVTVRLFQDHPMERRSATASIERRPETTTTTTMGQHERSKSAQGQLLASRERTGGLPTDGIESKPPLKLKAAGTGGRTTPRTRGPSPGAGVRSPVTLQRHPTVTDVSHLEELSSWSLASEINERPGSPAGGRPRHDGEEFNINSNTAGNLNIDGRPPSTARRSESSEPAATQLHPKPPKHGPTAAHLTPTADQLPTTANDFDKQPMAGGSSQRFPVVAPDGCDRFGFPLSCPLDTRSREADGSDPTGGHQFDSSIDELTLEEIHNYNEKLITDTANGLVGRPGRAGMTAAEPGPHLTAAAPHSSALNVANQPNRNWINLNSNQIYHQQRPASSNSCHRDLSSALPGEWEQRHAEEGHADAPGMMVMSSTVATAERTHVAAYDCEEQQQQQQQCRFTAGPGENANDNLRGHFRRGGASADRPRADYNYDNKSVRSHYRSGASPPVEGGARQPTADNGPLPDDAPPPPLPRYVTPSPPPPPPPAAATCSTTFGRHSPRARSGSSGSSVKINEIFEFPPPPPYPCDCGEPEEGEVEEQDEEERELRRWCTNVNEFESDRMRADGDTGRDYATSEQTSWPSQQQTVPAPPSSSSELLPSGGEFSGGDNDVSEAAPARGHDHRHRWDSSQNMSRFAAAPPAPSPPAAGNGQWAGTEGLNAKGKDDFGAIFSDDKTRLNTANANTAMDRNLAEEQNIQRRAVGPADKSIDTERWRSEAENRSSPVLDAPEKQQLQLQRPTGPPLRRMISFTDGEFIFGPIDERALQQWSDLASPAAGGRIFSTCPQARAGDANERRPLEVDAADGLDSGDRRLAPASSADTDAVLNVAPPSESHGTNALGEGKLIFAPRIATGPPAEETDPGWNEADEQNVACPRPASTSNEYERWARFENGNISPGAPTENIGAGEQNSKRLTRGDEIEEIFQQLNQTLKANVTKGASGGRNEASSNDPHRTAADPLSQLVENVPLIDGILDDLLTFSKQLLRKQQLAQERQAQLAASRPVSAKEPSTTGVSVLEAAAAAAAGEDCTGLGLKNRAAAQLTEINDDNLINLLAGDGDDAGRTDADGLQGAVDKSRNNEHHEHGDNSCNPELRSLPSAEEENENAKKRANNDQHSNQLPHHHQPTERVDEQQENWNMAPAQPQEDVFTNVAIFNWNPLDVYQQHGLFLIDPRFALADMRAESPALPASHELQPLVRPLPTVPEEPDNAGGNDNNDRHFSHQHQQPPGIPIQRSSVPPVPEMLAHARDTINNSSATITSMSPKQPRENVKFPPAPPTEANKNAPPSVAANRKMNTCHNYCRPSDDPLTTANVDGCFAGSSGIDEHDQLDKIVQMNQVLHVSDSGRPLADDPDGADDGSGKRDSANVSPAEGLKRVAWPPPAEVPEYEVHPSQQQHAVGQQIPVQQQQQPPQQFYQQPAPQQQQQQHPAYQQTNYQQQQQQQQRPNQPVERIIPIQRATSIQSPLATPTKSPVNQLKYPAYPSAGPRTVSPNTRGASTVAFSGGRAVQPSKQPQPLYQQQQPYQQQQQRAAGFGSPAPRSPGIPVASPRSPGSALSGGSPRGWAHVASPVPVNRPSPQAPFASSSPSPFYHQQPQQQAPQQYQQGYVPSAQGPGSNPPPAWYGARKPEDLQLHQQPLAPQYQNPLQQQPYQPQPTEAFQPLTAQQPPYQPPTVQPQQQQQQQQLPPTLVTTLRKEPPMSQEPAPVYQTQPVAAIYQGGSNMRGDQKWPPEEYKRQSEVDNEERRKLAQQPAFRPRRQQKDYGAFFAKNALNNTYPGYRAPPGTQHHA